MSSKVCAKVDIVSLVLAFNLDHPNFWYFEFYYKPDNFSQVSRTPSLPVVHGSVFVFVFVLDVLICTLGPC